MKTNPRQLALLITLAAALAGCQANPIGSAPMPEATNQDAQPAALSAEEAPAHYMTASASSLAVASMTASANSAAAAKANDNSYATYWQSGAVNKPTFRAVLAASATLTDLRIMVSPYGGTYTVETSADAKTWKVALSGVKNTTTSPEVKHLPAKTVGKYIRLTFANASKNVRLYELDVYGGAASAPAPTPKPVATPTPKPTATPAPSTGTVDPMVNQVLSLVNTERAKVGAKALTLSSAINKVAQFRSQDMVNRNYFAHTDPDGHDPFYWLKQYGVTYRSAGENIAMGQRTAAEVMNSWMNSSGHKANILNTSFGKIGIGIAKNSSGQIYWTQMFTD